MPFEKVEFSLPESDSEVDDNIDIEIEPSEELVVKKNLMRMMGLKLKS